MSAARRSLETQSESARRALLTRMLHREGLQDSHQEMIPRGRTDSLAPLSPGQERLWFLDQLHPGSAFYSIHNSVRIEASLDPSLLARAVNDIVRRHESLRTTFREIDGRPVQSVAPALTLDVPVIDLRHLGENAESKAAELAQAEARKPFDLKTGPLLRVTALRLRIRQWIIAVTIHHIIADDWSMSVLFRELGALYESHERGTPAPLQPLPVQMADVAIWQRAQSSTERLAADLRSWTAGLQDLPTLELPTDRPRPAIQSFAGSTYTFCLEAGVVEPIRQIAARQSATLFMGMLTGFAAILARYAGQTDLPIGTFTAGRTRPEFEPLIGFLVNTLVLRIDLRGDPTFRDALARVREVALDAYAHQDVPFERLVEALSPPRDPSRNLLVQVAFQLFGADAGRRRDAQQAPETLVVDRGASVFDLVFSGWEQADGSISCRVDYSTDLFDRQSIERMIQHYQRLLVSAAGSEGPLSDLEIIGQEERTILDGWNATANSFPNRGFVDLFAEQVARTPDMPALIFGDLPDVTYRELDDISTRLAHRLCNLAVGPERIVGLCAERSPALIVGLLAILKAGGAYLPLDPDYPRQRLTMMLDDARPHVILTTRSANALLPSTAAPVVCLNDSDWEPGPSSGVLPASDPARLAYVIYTSGSTGAPKGVMNTTGALVNRLHWMQQRFQLEASDRVVLKTPISFDVSVWELLWPLMTGAAMVLAQPGNHGNPRHLIQLFERQRVTTSHFVPAMLHAFLAEPDVSRCRSLRRVICSGEALSTDLQRAFFECLPGVDLHNLYGPTEAAIDVTAWQCDPSDNRSFVPIGRPISNLECHVVDERLRPLPIGVPGELCLAGVGLARGYLNRPDLTEERFVADPIRPTRRFYRTGDRARWTSDGVLEYLGRLDAQVKIRGVRIETGEVENALGRLPGVEAAAVIARPEPSGAMRLVAYVVPRPGSTPTLREIRAALADQLPETFVPTALVLMEQLPLTISGKLNRRALPEPDPDIIAGAAAPRDDLERALIGIWTDILARTGFGIHDNFFDLGGHSLLATQVVSRIRSQLLVDLPLAQFFERPTIAELADSCRERDRYEPRADAIEPLVRRSGDLRRHLEELSDDEIEISLQLALEQSGGQP
jgi:amino acid adenylation domain-containing protein